MDRNVPLSQLAISQSKLNVLILPILRSRPLLFDWYVIGVELKDIQDPLVSFTSIWAL